MELTRKESDSSNAEMEDANRLPNMVQSQQLTQRVSFGKTYDTAKADTSLNFGNISKIIQTQPEMNSSIREENKNDFVITSHSLKKLKPTGFTSKNKRASSCSAKSIRSYESFQSTLKKQKDHVRYIFREQICSNVLLDRSNNKNRSKSSRAKETSVEFATINSIQQRVVLPQDSLPEFHESRDPMFPSSTAPAEIYNYPHTAE